VAVPVIDAAQMTALDRALTPDKISAPRYNPDHHVHGRPVDINDGRPFARSMIGGDRRSKPDPAIPSGADLSPFRRWSPEESVPSGLEICAALHYRAGGKVCGLKDRPPAGCTQWQ
jgi:hypothetical protein